MIKINEVRIGNWFSYNGADEEMQIDANDFQYVINGHITDIEPIPLTEEWLAKFRFRKSGHIFWISLFNLKSELHIEIYPKENVITIESDFGILILDPIKHIHTLQNLYFALTGEELTIK